MKTRMMIIALLAAFVFLLGLRWYLTNTSRTESRWFREESPDGEHVLIADYKADYLYPPPTTVDIYLMSSSGVVGGYYINVTSKEPLDEDDYDVEWYEDHVNIRTKGDAGKEETVRIYWEE